MLLPNYLYFRGFDLGLTMVRPRLKWLCFSVLLAFQGVAAAEAMGWQKCHLHSELMGTSSETSHSHTSHGFDDHSELKITIQGVGPCNCSGSCTLTSTLSHIVESDGSKELASFEKATGQLGPVASETLPETPRCLLPYAQAPPDLNLS